MSRHMAPHSRACHSGQWRVMALSAPFMASLLQPGCAGPGGGAGPAGLCSICTPSQPSVQLFLYPAALLRRSPTAPGMSCSCPPRDACLGSISCCLIPTKPGCVRAPLSSVPKSWTSLLALQPTLPPGLVAVLKAALLRAEKLLA